MVCSRVATSARGEPQNRVRSVTGSSSAVQRCAMDLQFVVWTETRKSSMNLVMEVGVVAKEF